MKASNIDFVARAVEATIEPFEHGLSRISFFLADEDLKRIQAVAGGDASNGARNTAPPRV